MVILLCCVFFACRSEKTWVVTEITTIKEYGKSVDWFHQENLIVTARPLFDGYYDLLIFNMDDPDKKRGQVCS
jgi:hypothetical protein